MRSITFLLLLLFSNIYSSAQSSLIKVYNTHVFSCDKGGSTWQTNMCSGEKVDFADSLLNKLYNQILKLIDKDIAKDKASIIKERANKNTGKIDKSFIDFSSKEIIQNQKLKQSIINSQRQWLKVRDLNFEVAQLNCEGGTSCVAIANDSLIDDILERIKKLESFYYLE